MKKFPFLKQYDSMDCGPTCLAMICRYYGKPIAVQSLRERAQIGKEGVNLLGISEAAESIGLHSLAIQLSFEQLTQEARLPCVLHWKQNHFVVLYGLKQKNFWQKNELILLIADPAQGKRLLTAHEFRQAWQSTQVNGQACGVALLLEPGPDFEQEPESAAATTLSMRHIFSYALPYKKMLGQLALALLLASLLQLLLPFLTKSVVDTGINTQNLHFVYIVLLAQFALFSGRLMIEFIRSWILLHISSRINISILTDFLIKLMKLPLGFFDSKKTGDILQRLNDHHKIKTFLTGTSMNILFSGFSLITLSLALALFNTGIFMVFLASGIFYTLWIFLFLKWRSELDYKRFDTSAKEQSATIQMIQGMQEIKLNNCEKSVRWNWEHIQARLFKLSMKDLSLDQWQQSGAFFINEGKNILITFLCAKAVIEGQMTLGTMLAVQYILGQLNSPIEQMIGVIHSGQDARISMDRLNEIHRMEDEEPANRDFIRELPGDFKDQAADNGFGSKADASGIRLKNLSFTYEGAGNLPVLHSIDLFIPKGKTTAIVGLSGSGKTTLIKLLLKFYQPQQGEILIGATPLQAISHRAWRQHCGAVMQESFIFSDTIARNIAVGAEKIDIARLEYALSIAHVKDFVNSLPLGYHTKIGAEGNGISMGQKQRILLARAVYKDPEFVFLDEATNSLDAYNESVILQNLDKFQQGKTVVVVAHRLSTVKKAHQIIVLHKGMITEQGSHQELIRKKGEYYQLVKNQLELGHE